jgi:1-phosphofructokinase family hexose kinase
VILAAGLTPAWQQIVVLDELATGEVNRAREVHWCASGKVLNVGLALHCLLSSPPLSKGGQGGSRHAQVNLPNQAERSPVGRDTPGQGGTPGGEIENCRLKNEKWKLETGDGVAAKTLAIVGGQPGEAIRREFAELGVSGRWIVSQTPTRVCTTILDRQTGETTELVENAGAISPDELEAFRSAYFEEAARADVVVLTGSLPAGVPTTFYRDLIQKTPGRVVLDTQGEPLLAALESRPFVVKPNREELRRTLGRWLEDEGDLYAAMRELCQRRARWVVVSQGSEPVLAVSEDEVSAFGTFPVEVVNPIGSGDCLAAGIAAALARGDDVHDAVLFGMAAAAENVGQLLPARLDPERVAALADAPRDE